MGYKRVERQKPYQHDYYIKYRRLVRDRCRKYAKQNKAKVLRWFQEFKAQQRCQTCGEDDVRCLHFHHRDPKNKRFGISYAARTGIRIENLLEEIRKCDVLCANCHLKLHSRTIVTVAQE